jgi:hypothetical protein
LGRRFAEHEVASVDVREPAVSVLLLAAGGQAKSLIVDMPAEQV